MRTVRLLGRLPHFGLEEWMWDDAGVKLTAEHRGIPSKESVSVTVVYQKSHMTCPGMGQKVANPHTRPESLTSQSVCGMKPYYCEAI
jgi:hypothetical protein